MTLLTEEEAREKWCHRYPCLSNMGFKCGASDCMAWRWANKKLGHELEKHVSDHGEEAGRISWERFCKADPLMGYCGLAGKP